MKRLPPLPLLLTLQALLMFWRLDLLSPWFDEAHTLIFMRGPLREAIEIPASGLHPPLYFLLLWCWMRLPLGLAWTAQARALSALFTLASTAAFDRLWARRLTWRARWWALALWAFSPYLLLYGRMSRSYSLQLLLGIVAAALILRFAGERSGRNFAMLAIASVIAVYTHYVPGFALLAAANVILIRRKRWRDAAALDCVAALALAPWMTWLIPQLEAWGAHHVAYALTGGGVSEIALKLAYWAMSFTLGEAAPDAALIAGAALIPLALFLVFEGARRKRELGWLAAVFAGIGFLGVTRWVSYPFIPARMIFCFPMFLVLFIEGSALYPRTGRIVRLGALALSISGVWCYFHLTGFRNKQYSLPMSEIAARIRAGAPPERAAVLVDSANSDIFGLRYAMGPAAAPVATEDPDAQAKIAQWLNDRNVRTIWFLRNTHDVSRDRLNTRLADELGGKMRVTSYPYEPFSPLELRLMRALGMRDPPRCFHELLEFRR